MARAGTSRGGIFQFRVMKSGDISGFIDGLCAEKEVHAPQRKGKKYAFGRLNSADRICLDYDVTMLPPKKYFLPQEEDLIRFSLEKDPKVEPVIEAREIVLFGVHPYDIAGMNVLDHAFSDGHRDPNYLEKRDRAVVIGLTPERVNPYAFAGQMDAVRVRDGFDLFFTRVDGHYIIAVASDRGLDILDGFATTTSAHEKDVERFYEVEEKLAHKLTNWSARFTYEELPALLDAHMKHPIWEQHAASCLSCGSCNLVCPTCYCFDVIEDVALDMSGGTRSRRWDGCLLEGFAAVAGDENFREDRAARFRHRFLRKGKIMQERLGVVGCVGCGRCSIACLPDIANPIEVFNALKEEQ